MSTAADSEGGSSYRFGFVLTTALGNRTRYANFRKYADRDRSVTAVWAPVSHYIEPGTLDPFRRWPGPVRTRAIVVMQAMPVLRALGSLDAVMIHQYDVDLLLALRSLVFRRPIRVVSGDDAPILDPATYPMHPVDRGKSRLRQRMRLALDIFRTRHADGLVPYSHWSGALLIRAGAAPDMVHPLHTGVDLETWIDPPGKDRAGRRSVRFLFVGGEFERKGGPDLLAAFSHAFSDDRAELDIVTKSAVGDVPRGVRVHPGLEPNDETLRSLFRDADVLVHPTRSDLSGWVVLEAMASSCAVITTTVGGIPELIEDALTGILVEPGNVSELMRAMRELATDPARCHEMGQRGRRRVEEHFNAAKNVPIILDYMKRLADNSPRRRSAL